MSPATDFTASDSTGMQEGWDARIKKGAGSGKNPVTHVRFMNVVNIRGIVIPHFVTHQR